MTNIGDVVLTCPVIDILRNDFPQAKIDVLTGPKAVSLFADNPGLITKVFNKQAPLKQKVSLLLDLYKGHYDCVVDLRMTALAFFLAPSFAAPVLFGPSFKGHKKGLHLDRLRQVYEFDTLSPKQHAILTTKEDESFFDKELAPVLQGEKYVVIAPGAADSAKRWHSKGFAAVADQLATHAHVVFVGDDKDARIVEDIQGLMKSKSLSLAGKINLRQLAYVLKKCAWAMTHDSGVMHLACYFNVPVIALWGPTSLEKYAPWTERSVIVRRNEKCVRCLDPKSKALHDCMSYIQVQDVLDAVKKLSAIKER